jgi:hypothetical protein
MNNQLELNSTQEAIRILNKYPIILQKTMATTETNQEQAVKLFDEVVKYLIVCSESDVSLTPSPIVDKSWHEFIVHTKAYSDFCSNKLGKFIHHIPSGDASLEGRYELTKAKMYERFGQQVNKDFWEGYNFADCGCDGNPSCVSAPE